MRAKGTLARAAGAAALAGLLAVVVAPLAVIVAGSLFDTSLLGASSETWGRSGQPGRGWFAYVLDLYGPQLLRSVRLAALVVGLALAVGTPAAYAIAKGRGRALQALLEVPLAVPGLAVAIGMILAYPRWRSSVWILASGHLLYALPFFVRATVNALTGSPLAELEAAAATAGAGALERWRRVVLPLARPGLLAGLLMAFTISWGEFNVSFLLATPATQTFPAALYLTYTTNSFPVGAAATAIFLAAAVPALALLQRVARREAADFGEAA